MISFYWGKPGSVCEQCSSLFLLQSGQGDCSGASFCGLVSEPALPLNAQRIDQNKCGSLFMLMRGHLEKLLNSSTSI